MAKSILLVKTSSLGDVIHALPAVSDMRAAVPGLQVDWLVEESLVAIPRLHAGVASIIPVALRRWRRSFWQAETRREMSAFAARLRTHSYDAVIDAQGLFKSAVIALFARGPRYGLDFHSAREPLGLFYQQTFRVGWDIHAVERNRLLAASVLGYANARPCNYGISAAARCVNPVSTPTTARAPANKPASAPKSSAGAMIALRMRAASRTQRSCSRVLPQVKTQVVSLALNVSASATQFDSGHSL